jgi:hypothetical protein
MKATLTHSGFWELITGDEAIPDEDKKDVAKKKAFEKRQAQCISELVLSANDSQLSHMISTDPKIVWESFTSVHHARGFGSCLQLQWKFITASMKENQSMESWIREVRMLSNKLKAFNIMISDEDVVVVLTAGLPSSYISVIILLHARQYHPFDV